MKEARRSSGAHTARGPGSYTAQACSVCRHKKIKCDGGKPCCETCVNNGRESECTYGKEVGRRPRTEAHFQSMRQRLEVISLYARHLESLLDLCQKEHGGSTAYGYQQYRPDGWDEIPESPEEAATEVVEEEEEKDGSDVANELCLPTQNLRLAEEGGLLLHGATAPFRYISEAMRPPAVSRLWTISENPDECYTLLVDGADESHFNPNFDWSRHLPSEVHIDRREHDRTLELTFKFFTSWCLRIVPPLFLRDMFRALKVPKNEPPPRLTHYSAMLHNALMAIGTAFSDDPTIRDLRTRMYFVEKAKTYMEDECSKPHLSVVNALSLLGSFHSSQGDQTLGYVFFGMSARVGQALGLGVDCSSWVESGYITAEDQADRNWAYWTTYCQDVCWSLYVGREFCIPSMSRNVPIPFVDADFDKMDWHYPPSGIPPQPGYESKTFSSTCQLSMIAKSIMDVVNTLDGPGNRQMVLDPKISEIDLALHQWNSNLPEELKNTVRMRSNPTPHLLQLHLTFNWSFILLHRPFYRRRSKTVVRDNTIDHAKTCKRSADSIMDLLGLWRQYFTLRYVPITLVQTIFSAGTIYLLSALQSVEGVRVANKELRHAMQNTLDCIQYLKEVGESWPCATKIANILRDWQQQTKPKIRERTAFSPFSSGILPPKQPERPQIQTKEGSEVLKRKSKTSGGGPKKRQRSLSGTNDSSARQPTETGASQKPPAPSISVVPSSGGEGDGSLATAPAPARSPVVNQVLQLPTPPHIAHSPRGLQPQSSLQLEAPSPQPLQRSPYHAHSPLPTQTQHLQVQQSSIAPQGSPRPFIPVSPQPHAWNTLSDDASMTDPHQHSTSPLKRPAAPPPTHEQVQLPSQSQRQTQSANSTSPFNAVPNVNTFANGLSLQNQPVFPNYHFWAPGALLPAPNGHALHTESSSTGGGNATGRPISPTSYQLAMPNGQGLWETPFFPLSFPEVEEEQEHDQDHDQMTALNELGFEFVNRQALSEGVGAMEGVDGMGDMDMEWRGREGWEDIGGDIVREEDFLTWFGAGVSEN